MSSRSRSRQLFFRGLAIILPTVLTIWLVVVAYQFVAERIARPINRGVRWSVIQFSPLPVALEQDRIDRELEIQNMAGEEGAALRVAMRNAVDPRAWLDRDTRRTKLDAWWGSYTIGQWVVLDLIGLVIAIVLIYMIGLLLSGFIGRRIYARGEELIGRVPLIRRVYPAMKQVTDFFFSSDDQSRKFSRVVAVEYPRKGIWSVGLVTGDTMADIQQRVASHCLTVFVPSSPTPFTGYVITVSKEDTIDLPVSIEDALKFAVSLGVVVPPDQMLGRAGGLFEPDRSAPPDAGRENVST